MSHVCCPQPLLPINAAPDEYPELRPMEASTDEDKSAAAEPKPTAAKSAAIPKPKDKGIVFDVEGEDSPGSAARRLQPEKQIEFVKMWSLAQ